MRKYLIGFIAGILVATAGVAAADTVSLIGKKIQSEAIVTLDGEEIGTALIIDGTSYPPLRVVAEAVGVGVGYEKGVVKLESQAEKPKSLSYWEGRLDDLSWSLMSAQKLVTNSKNSIATSLEIIEKWETRYNGLPSDASTEMKESLLNTLLDLETGHAELEAELKQRQDRVAEIEQEIIYVKVQIAAAK